MCGCVDRNSICVPDIHDTIIVAAPAAVRDIFVLFICAFKDIIKIT